MKTIKRTLKKGLTPTDKNVYSMIKESEEFNLTDKKICEILEISKGTINSSLRRLREKGLIYNYSFDGRRRVLKIKG